MKSFQKWVEEKHPEALDEAKWLYPALLGGMAALGGIGAYAGKNKQGEPATAPTAQVQAAPSATPAPEVPPGMAKPGMAGDASSPKSTFKPASLLDRNPTKKVEPTPAAAPTPEKESPKLDSKPYDPVKDGPKDAETAGFDEDEAKVIKKAPAVKDMGDHWLTLGCGPNLHINKEDPQSKLSAYKVARLHALKNLLITQNINPGFVRGEEVVKSYVKGDYVFTLIKVPKSGVRVRESTFASFVRDRRRNLSEQGTGLYHKKLNPTGTKFPKPATKSYNSMLPAHDYAMENPHTANPVVYLENVRRVAVLFRTRFNNMIRKNAANITVSVDDIDNSATIGHLAAGAGYTDDDPHPNQAVEYNIQHSLYYNDMLIKSLNRYIDEAKKNKLDTESLSTSLAAWCDKYRSWADEETRLPPKHPAVKLEREYEKFVRTTAEYLRRFFNLPAVNQRSVFDTTPTEDIW